MAEDEAVPKNLEQAYALVERLTIDDLRVFCSTFQLDDSRTKEQLKRRLIQYYQTRFTVEAYAKKPFSIRKVKDPEERIDDVENSVRELKSSIQNELAGFRQSMEAIITKLQTPTSSTPLPPKVNFVEETHEEFVRSDNSIQQDTILLSKISRKKRFLTSTVERIMTELQRLIRDEADIKLVERKLIKLNAIESKWIKAIDETVMQLDNDELAENEMEQWEDVRAQILQTEEQAELYISRNATAKSRDHGLKLPSLDLPQFAGKIIEWPAFYDAFKAAVGSNTKLGNVQKLTHLRSCLKGTALRCIEGYSVINENYEKALQDLKTRFGRKRSIVSELVKSILGLKIPDEDDSKALRYLLYIMKNRLRSLESNGLKIKDNDSLSMVMLPILESKLPGELREKWELKVEEEKCNINIDSFFDFLEGHVISKETRNVAEGTRVSGRFSKGKIGKKEERLVSASALLNHTESKPICGFCSKPHDTEKCKVALDRSPEERWKRAKDLNAPWMDVVNVIITYFTKTRKQLIRRNEEVETITGFVSLKTGQQSLLPTALARLIHEGNELVVRILFDSGSEETFVRSSVVDSLGLKRNNGTTSMKINMLGGESQEKKVHRVSFKLAPLHTTGETESTYVEAWTVKNVCVPLSEVKFDLKQCPHLTSLNLAEKFPRPQATVDVLIGIDQYHKLVGDTTKWGTLGTPIATSSVFGWIVGGPVPGSKRKNNKTTSMLSVTQVDNVDEVLKRFWSLDALGIVDEIKDSLVTSEEKYAMDQFESNLQYDGERYTVGLPWMRNPPPLVNNYHQAFQRLISVEKRLKRNPKKTESYRNAMNQYLTDGHARETDQEDEKNEKARYLPQHAVFREDKASTKCRIVFDASSKTSDGVSLNSCLLKGPKLQLDLVHVLIRFRSHRIAMMADIKKMFLQICLLKKEQNSHRFLWRDLTMDDPPKEYCMTQVTFGNTSSPFVSIATVQKHAKDNHDTFPTASEEIQDNMYVDDLLSGSDDDEAAIKLQSECSKLMEKGGFVLTKWASNSATVMENIPEKDRATSTVISSKQSEHDEKMSDLLKALGVAWNTRKDIFLFEAGEKLVSLEDSMTKRSLISLYARLFDPMGLIAPFLMRPKVLFQELWLRERDINKIELHGFGDASEKAYGAAIYLCAEDKVGKRISNLIMAKSRVAPTRRITLPRLELLAAYLTAKLTSYVIEALKTPVQEVYAWSDSQIVLNWIRQPCSKWKVFVANRVQEIQQKVDPSKWHHCPGDQNPADLLTRGISANQLANSTIWWNGPPWLLQSVDRWPKRVSFENLIKECLIEARKQSTVACHFGAKAPCYPDMADKYESWQRLLRITSWILKWLHSHGIRKTGQLSAQEIKNAELCWLKIIQKNVFHHEYNNLSKGTVLDSASSILKLDPIFDWEKELMRVGGRLEFADIPYEAKHQIIIPKKDKLVEKLILHLHIKASHPGPETTLAILRQRFWIIGGRREVKRILKKCLVCQHWKTQPCQQKMAERVHVTHPFTNVGLDFMGPLYLKVKDKEKPSQTHKAYVCIFVCEDTRAVHLELTNNMTTEEFLQAFRRMKIKLSGFDPKGAQDRLANEGVVWKFITERASHRGGHWERVCRQIKEPLRKVLRKSFLTYTEMMTILTDIEAIINSRPLTYIGDNINDGVVLTPALLVLNRNLGEIPEHSSQNLKVSLSQRYRYLQRLQHHFWSRWLKKYLPRLTTRQKWLREISPLKPNDVVLVSDDGLPRGKWILGKIENTFPGRDGIIRTATIRTRTGKINRPIQKLHLLEEYRESIPSQQLPCVREETRKEEDRPRSVQEENVSSPLVGEDVGAQQRKSKYGRIIKPVKR
ncbi:uncharacterized protein LOC114531378 [Dendronephthya gigantea]|uniref:uncharacterized protein LOC114531378 n=1 Tax=Dendronephthya gigantea TaxID=151771 RepID=UPI00106DCDDC|nr:uncharacterized protein LOC114531378 [Dendronephthya gigantea]